MVLITFAILHHIFKLYYIITFTNSSSYSTLLFWTSQGGKMLFFAKCPLGLFMYFSVLLAWWVPYGTHVLGRKHIDRVLDYSVLLGCWDPYGTHVFWGHHIDLVLGYSVFLGWWVPYKTHVIWGHHIDLVLGYSVFLGWWFPYGTHVIWGHPWYWPDALDSSVLLWWWVPYKTHVIWGHNIDLVLGYSVFLRW